VADATKDRIPELVNSYDFHRARDVSCDFVHRERVGLGGSVGLVRV
jgi:hypothetical protein